jgi:cyclohexanecarboxylate-CoA ligase
VSMRFDDVVPSGPVARRYRAAGWWRDGTASDDLRSAARRYPGRTALVTGRGGGLVRLTYGQLERQVDRFCRALQVLEPPPRVVAFQLPDWWESAALTLACMRLGLVAMPLLITLRERELRQALQVTGAQVCIVPDEHGGYPHAQVLADIAAGLPGLAHRVVIGDAAATSAADFGDLFLAPVAGGAPPPRPADPDQACLVLFTSGTTGHPKAVLHSHNTAYAGARNSALAAAVPAPGTLVAATTFTISHLAGLQFAVLGPLTCGGTGVFQDTTGPGQFLDLAAQSAATRIFAVPARLFDLLDEQHRQPRHLAALRCIRTGATPISPRLVTGTEHAFGVPVQASWGMTETGWATLVPASQPPGTSARSDGQPLPGVELDITAPAGTASVGHLRVRGPSVCLATASRAGQLTLTASTSEGWYPTGDLARSDGHGGIKITGRTADRVGGNLLIPVHDIEQELATHPAIADVALIGIPDERAGEQVCAVIVPAGTPPTLAELCGHLTARGVTGWYHPTRLETTSQLPRDHLGKIQQAQLRATYSPRPRP